MEVISKSVRDTLYIGKRLSRNLKAGDILCLFGQLGSGKTVLVKGIAQGLGISQRKVISPSFVLIRQYQQANLPLCHFDLYRLKSPSDILALGYEEYFYNQGITIIEWAQRLDYLLPKEYLKITLEVVGEKRRKIKIIPKGRGYEPRYTLLCSKGVK